MFRRNFCEKQPPVYPLFAIQGWQKGRVDQPEATPQTAESGAFDGRKWHIWPPESGRLDILKVALSMTESATFA